MGGGKTNWQRSRGKLTNQVVVIGPLTNCLRPAHRKDSVLSRFSRHEIGSDHAQVVSCCFQSLFGIAVRDKPGVVVKRQIALTPEAVEHGQKTRMFLVQARPYELDDGDVVPRLASGTKSVAEHEA